MMYPRFLQNPGYFLPSKLYLFRSPAITQAVSHIKVSVEVEIIAKKIKYLFSYLKVTPVPIWPLTKCHGLPHNYSKAPNITSWTKFPVPYRFGRCPSNWNFTTLEGQTNVSLDHAQLKKLSKQVNIRFCLTSWASVATIRHCRHVVHVRLQQLCKTQKWISRAVFWGKLR